MNEFGYFANFFRTCVRTHLGRCVGISPQQFVWPTKAPYIRRNYNPPPQSTVGHVALLLKKAIVQYFSSVPFDDTLHVSMSDGSNQPTACP